MKSKGTENWDNEGGAVMDKSIHIQSKIDKARARSSKMSPFWGVLVLVIILVVLLGLLNELP